MLMTRPPQGTHRSKTGTEPPLFQATPDSNRSDEHLILVISKVGQRGKDEL